MTINFSSAGTFLHLNAISTVPDRYYPFKVQTSNEQNLQDIPFYTLLIFSSAGTFNFSSAGTFLHLNGIRTVPNRCYPFKVQTSNEQTLQDIPFYTLLIFSSTFSSAVYFNFSSAGPNNFSSAGTFLHLNGIKTVPDRCYPFKVQTSNEQNLQDIPFYTLLIFSSAGTFNFSSTGTFNFSSAGTFNFSSTGPNNFSSAGTFLHLNGIKTVPDRCYPFKVQTSNEQNLQDIPFYTLLIFSSALSSTVTFNFRSAGPNNFSSAGTFLHLNGIKTVPDRCYPFKVQTSNEQNLQDFPFYTLLIFSSAGTINFSSAGTINFSSAGTFNFSSAGTFLNLNGPKTVPDRCYPFKVQTSNEQNLQDIPFYTLLIFSSTGTFNFSSTGTFNFSSTGTINFSSAVTFNFSSTGPNNFSSTGTFLHLNGTKTAPDRCYPIQSPNIKWAKSARHSLLYPTHF